MKRVPNWQHHSKKEQKRRLKPQALRQAKARKQALKRKLQVGHSSAPFSVCGQCIRTRAGRQSGTKGVADGPRTRYIINIKGKKP